MVLFSSFVALAEFPSYPWRFGIALAILATVSIFLRVGWFVPFTIAGSYFGMIVLDPPVKGGTVDSQMNQTVMCVVLGTIGGFVIGAVLDARRRGG